MNKKINGNNFATCIENQVKPTIVQGVKNFYCAFLSLFWLTEQSISLGRHQSQAQPQSRQTS